MEELATLVVQAQAGDLTAYGVIVQRCQGMALATAHSRLRDRHLAQDVTQEAFVRAYRDLTDLREPAAFPGWFKRIVFKYCDRATREKSCGRLQLSMLLRSVPQCPARMMSFTARS